MWIRLEYLSSFSKYVHKILDLDDETLRHDNLVKCSLRAQCCSEFLVSLRKQSLGGVL